MKKVVNEWFSIIKEVLPIILCGAVLIGVFGNERIYNCDLSWYGFIILAIIISGTAVYLVSIGTKNAMNEESKKIDFIMKKMGIDEEYKEIEKRDKATEDMENNK